MIPESGHRFSDEIMLIQEDRSWCRFNWTLSWSNRDVRRTFRATLAECSVRKWQIRARYRRARAARTSTASLGSSGLATRPSTGSQCACTSCERA